jgi:DNA polymerase III subunit chi
MSNPMAEVLFYHLTRTPLEATLPALLTRSLAAGWRVAVRGTSPQRLTWLDEQLWLSEGFLPHGLAGGPQDADQPVLLTLAATSGNGANSLMLIDGAAFDPAELPLLVRTSVLFDGGDDAAMTLARQQWKMVCDTGLAAHYWSDESGSWQKKASRDPGPRA